MAQQQHEQEQEHFKGMIRPVDQEIVGGGSKSKQCSPTEFYPPLPSAAEDDGVEQIFSTQKSQMDYVTWKGIESRTGIEKKNAYEFVLKELLDNAVDFLEDQHNNSSSTQPEIQVTFKERAKLFRIGVRNSNYGGKAAFSRQMLKSIFDFDRFYSSKRNQFKITKGALGDAFKEILCIPYALAREELGIEGEGWDEPLIIRDYNANRVFSIHLTVDRINQTIQSEVRESKISADANHRYSTEIEVAFPIVRGANRSLFLDYMMYYATFVTHIGFSFEDENLEFSFRYKQLQTINPKWKNQSSIYYYEPAQFQDFILGLENNDSEMYTVLYKTFRGASNMKKTELTKMTIGQLKQSRKHMCELYNELRSSMNPASTLALPFDATKKVREPALKTRIEYLYGDVLDMKYRSVFGCYESYDRQLKIPFFFEIAVCNIENLQRHLTIIQALNCSAIASNRMVFQGCYFDWVTQGSKSIYESDDIRDIFEHYGYSQNKDECKKPNTLIIANLISPKIDYQSYGKSRIDFRPFAHDIAETTVKACMGGGGRSDGKPSKNAVLLELLTERKLKWYSLDAASRLKNWWTQSMDIRKTKSIENT